MREGTRGDNPMKLENFIPKIAGLKGTETTLEPVPE